MPTDTPPQSSPPLQPDQKSCDTFARYLSIVRQRKNLRTIAILECEAEWAQVEVLTAGTTLSTIDHRNTGQDYNAYFSQNTTISPTSIRFDSPEHWQSIHGVVPFVIVGNGEPVDILITHGRSRQQSVDVEGRTSVYISGITYSTQWQSSSSTMNSQTFTNCPLIHDDKFFTPGVLCFGTNWAKLHTSTPGTTFSTVPGYQEDLCVGDSGQSLTFGSPHSERFNFGIKPFAVVSDGGPIDITITRGEDGYFNGSGGAFCDVLITKKPYQNSVYDDLPNSHSFTGCPVIDVPPQSRRNFNKSNPSPANNQEPGEIFALIIGINRYLHEDGRLRPLTGAVADANDMYDFCKSTLRVPEERIQNLRDQQASRTNIIQAVEALGGNPDIKLNDPVLIYFAGHGSQTAAPGRWPANGNVQMILPYDFNPNGTEESPIDEQGILDLELARLLDNVAEKKSNNITLIFDSCHSASISRSIHGSTSRSVKLPPSYAISQDLVGHLAPKNRASSVGKGFDRKGLASHILLAACQEIEEAYEHAGRGAFTVELLRLLRERGVNNLTYNDVILLLPKLRASSHLQQNPQCEGVHQYRTLFDGRVPTLRRQTFEIAGVKNKPGVYKLYAGEAEGVMPGAVFAVYDNRELDGCPLGYVQTIPPEELKKTAKDKKSAESKQMVHTICKIAPNQHEPTSDHESLFSLQSKRGFAIQVDAGSAVQVRFLLDLGGEHAEVCEEVKEDMQDGDMESVRVEFVNDRDANPELVVTAEGEFARFEIMDLDCRQHGLTSTPYKEVYITTGTISRILRAAAHFFFHLRRSSQHSSHRLLSANVNIECHKLVDTEILVNGVPTTVLMPADDDDLIEDGVLRVPSDPDALYGFSITSQFNDGGLYAALFYFDMSDFSISRYYLPNEAGRGGGVYSIPPKGAALTVGYGESGTEPRTYTVRRGQSVDVGFLRLFVSTDYADWTMIEQSSPFVGFRMTIPGGLQEAVVGWGAKTLTVMVERGDELDDTQDAGYVSDHDPVDWTDEDVEG